MVLGLAFLAFQDKVDVLPELLLRGSVSLITGATTIQSTLLLYVQQQLGYLFQAGLTVGSLCKGSEAKDLAETTFLSPQL
jgi:hypothetical protein